MTTTCSRHFLIHSSAQKMTRMFGMLMLMTLLVVSGVQSHDYYLGNCPRVSPIASFDTDRFLGRWYVIQKFSTASSCWMYDFVKANDTVQIVQSRDHVILDTLGMDNTYKYTGTLDQPDLQNPGAMRVRFPLSIAGKADYIVYDTDYTNYAAIYSCQSILFGHRRSASILSRKPTLDENTVASLRTKLEKSGVDSHDFSIIEQSNCKNRKEGDETNINFGVDPDTFSATSIGNAVRGAGNAIGTGIQKAGEGINRAINVVAGSDSGTTTGRITTDAEWVSGVKRRAINP